MRRLPCLVWAFGILLEAAIFPSYLMGLPKLRLNLGPLTKARCLWSLGNEVGPSSFLFRCTKRAEKEKNSLSWECMWPVTSHTMIMYTVTQEFESGLVKGRSPEVPQGRQT